jgi:hypothetical protein
MVNLTGRDLYRGMEPNIRYLLNVLIKSFDISV